MDVFDVIYVDSLKLLFVDWVATSGELTQFVDILLAYVASYKISTIESWRLAATLFLRSQSPNFFTLLLPKTLRIYQLHRGFLHLHRVRYPIKLLQLFLKLPSLRMFFRLFHGSKVIIFLSLILHPGSTDIWTDCGPPKLRRKTRTIQLFEKFLKFNFENQSSVVLL